MLLFNRIRTLSLSALTAALLVAPACDDGANYEALGITVEDLESMSAEELDELDSLLGEVDIGVERTVTHGAEDPVPPTRPEFAKAFAIPLVFTHAEHPGFIGPLKAPTRPTHSGVDFAPAAAQLADGPDGAGPCDPHGPNVELTAR